MIRGISIFAFFLFTKILSGQSITPFTLNIGGFTSQQNGYSLTVSTGEAISIVNFTNPNGVSLNSGFLQNNPPIVTGIDDITSKIATNEITITPNPATSFTNLVVNFLSVGKIQYQILDATSKLLFRSAAINVSYSNKNKIDMSVYPAGTYYISVVYKPNIGNAKSGIYKIVKI